MGRDKSFQLLFLDKETSSGSEVLLYAYYAFFSGFRHLSNMSQWLISSKMLTFTFFAFFKSSAEEAATSSQMTISSQSTLNKNTWTGLINAKQQKHDDPIIF